jgi:hypothetical protein
MTEIGVAFEVLAESQRAPPVWSKVTGHLIWDLKMDFRRKARWVLNGHKTPNPIGSTYAGVVSRDSVRIAFTYAALNGVDVCAADIKNAYLQAPSSCKNYIICGPEFGLENVGKVALIHCALCIRWKIRRTQLQEPPAILYETIRFRILPGRS